MNAVIKIVKGKHVGKSFYLVKNRRLIVGNDVACDIQLAEVGVSRRHFTVEWDGEKASITDLGSNFDSWGQDYMVNLLSFVFRIEDCANLSCQHEMHLRCSGFGNCV